MKKYLLIALIASFLISGCKNSAPAHPLTCNAVMGYAADNNNNYRLANFIVATQFTASADSTVNAMKVKLTYPANIIAAVYSDSSSLPGTVLTQTALYAGQTGWNAVPVPDCHLTSGTKYWLAVVADAAGISSYDLGATALYEYASLSIDDTVKALGLPPGNTLIWTSDTGEIKITALNCK